MFKNCCSTKLTEQSLIVDTKSKFWMKYHSTILIKGKSWNLLLNDTRNSGFTKQRNDKYD